jgi:hypothetical protein
MSRAEKEKLKYLIQPAGLRGLATAGYSGYKFN